ncbi:hypothetical protein PLESTB_001742200 [Pleodorina starrii]|uniref:Uncharacterized protein n=1 Tax=Pleodorina starrii TaxID=330485 RepID=A0A9W6C1B4_9CHLO|nr:hypothetical protein PLESTB_001742200 [Pleodorina starrii]
MLAGLVLNVDGPMAGIATARTATTRPQPPSTKSQYLADKLIAVMAAAIPLQAKSGEEELDLVQQRVMGYHLRRASAALPPAAPLAPAVAPAQPQLRSPWSASRAMRWRRCWVALVAPPGLFLIS